MYFDFGEIKPSVCANRNSYVRRPNGSLMCFVGCHPCPVLFPRQVIAPTLQRFTVLNDPGGLIYGNHSSGLHPVETG